MYRKTIRDFLVRSAKLMAALVTEDPEFHSLWHTHNQLWIENCTFDVDSVQRYIALAGGGNVTIRNNTFVSRVTDNAVQIRNMKSTDQVRIISNVFAARHLYDVRSNLIIAFLLSKKTEDG